jgi:ribosomal protein S18 acetylase RimI-like enzyme
MVNICKGDLLLEIALRHHCYKVMLLTGSKNEATLHFYERAGFVRGEKTGFVVRASGDGGDHDPGSVL